MKREFRFLKALILVFGLMFWAGGCAKKVVPPPAAKTVEPEPPKPAPLPPAAPTITLSAQPSTIMKGQSTVLSWQATNAVSVELDGGIGTVAHSGQKTLTPSSSVTYTAKATGAGGSVAASTRITVEIPAAPVPTPLSDREFFDKRIRDVFFDYDEHDIRADQLLTADNNVRALKERSDLKVLIEGHCDERGSEKYNLALGDKRANAVKAYLVKQGISEERIDTTSYGKERPFDPGHGEEAWAQNRRGHFVLK